MSKLVLPHDYLYRRTRIETATTSHSLLGNELLLAAAHAHFEPLPKTVGIRYSSGEDWLAAAWRAAVCKSIHQRNYLDLLLSIFTLLLTRTWIAICPPKLASDRRVARLRSFVTIAAALG